MTQAAPLFDVNRTPPRALAILFADIEAFMGRFVAFPSEHTRVAVVLWVAHTHCFDQFETTPRLAFLSPEPGSGKTRAQEVLELLVPHPMATFNVSAAVLYRSMGADIIPTVLLDEADTIFGPRASKDHEDLRGLINAGYRRGAMAQRCATRGKEIVIEQFPAFAPVCIAGLNDLPDTIMTRCIVVRMRRRAPSEKIEPYRRRIHRHTGESLRDELAVWAASASHDGETFPEMPKGVEDRDADVWEPLLALAEAAGADWSKRAKAAAKALVEERKSKGSDLSLGVRLLVDIKSVFTTANADRMSTENLILNLRALDEAPWDDLRGKPLDSRGVAARLRKYDIHPKQVRIGADKVRGYERGDFIDAWSRYSPSPPEGSGTSGTSGTHETPEAVDVPDVPDVPDIPEGEGLCSVCREPLDDVLGEQVHVNCAEPASTTTWEMK